jgi:hypothetical protein
VLKLTGLSVVVEGGGGGGGSGDCMFGGFSSLAAVVVDSVLKILVMSFWLVPLFSLLLLLFPFLSLPLPLARLGVEH